MLVHAGLADVGGAKSGRCAEHRGASARITIALHVAVPLPISATARCERKFGSKSREEHDAGEERSWLLLRRASLADSVAAQVSEFGR